MTYALLSAASPTPISSRFSLCHQTSNELVVHAATMALLYLSRVGSTAVNSRLPLANGRLTRADSRITATDIRLPAGHLFLKKGLKRFKNSHKNFKNSKVSILLLQVIFYTILFFLNLILIICKLFVTDGSYS